MSTIKNGVTLLSIVVLLSCTDTGILPTEEILLEIPDEYIEIPNQPIDAEILYSFSLDSHGQDKTVSLYFRTRRDYPSSGYKILGGLSRTDSRFAVHLDNIQRPEAGLAVLAPAGNVFQLGTLLNGAYTFEIKINGKVVRMILLLSNSGVQTSIQPNNLISRVPLNHSLLFRKWINSYEEQTDNVQIYRPSDYKEFPFLRFRGEYEFRENGECIFYVLHPADAHYYETGTWKVSPEDGYVLEIFDGSGRKFNTMQIIELNNNILRFIYK